MKNTITPLDTILYYTMCFFTGGAAFFTKIIVKKAISEMVK